MSDNINYWGTIASIMGHRRIEGEVALEIECEGNIFKKSRLPSPWVYVEDHSLRGEDNAEYVFDGPKLFSEVPAALDKLWDVFDKTGTILDDSNRTSVHVHMNAQGWHLNRLASFAALFFSVEEILSEWCGDHRVGNLFCLRAVDAPAIVWELKKFLKSKGEHYFEDHLHYGGLNLHALKKYGSIEVRTMRGTPDRSLIVRWVNILENIYRLSGEMSNPQDVPALFSMNGPEYFLKKVIGPEYLNIRSDLPMSEDEIRESVYRGIRVSQDICYCLDWALYRPKEETTDPFKRGKSLEELVAYYTDLHAQSQLQTQQEISYVTPSPYPPLQSLQPLSWSAVPVNELPTSSFDELEF